MIEIIKEGKFTEQDTVVFECTYCECVFKISRNECKRCSFYNATALITDCPCCNERLTKSVE